MLKNKGFDRITRDYRGQKRIKRDSTNDYKRLRKELQKGLENYHITSVIIGLGLQMADKGLEKMKEDYKILKGLLTP